MQDQGEPSGNARPTVSKMAVLRKNTGYVPLDRQGALRVPLGSIPGGLTGEPDVPRWLTFRNKQTCTLDLCSSSAGGPASAPSPGAHCFYSEAQFDPVELMGHVTN